MNQHYSNLPNLKTPSSYSGLVSELRFGDHVWCPHLKGLDPRHVQGCQDGSTGLEAQVPGHSRFNIGLERFLKDLKGLTSFWVDMDPDGSIFFNLQ